MSNNTRSRNNPKLRIQISSESIGQPFMQETGTKEHLTTPKNTPPKIKDSSGLSDSDDNERDIKKAIKKMKKETKVNKLTKIYKIQKNGTTNSRLNIIAELQSIQKENKANYPNPQKKKSKCASFINKIPVINPDCLFMTIWNIIILLLMIYTGLIMPYRICFTENDTTFWRAFETTIDFIFIFDILINLNLGYKNEENEYITNRFMIFKNYLCGWFFIDIISSLPQNLIFPNNNLKTGAQLVKLVKLTKLNRLIRFFRLIKVVRFLKKISFFNTFFEFVQLNYGVSQLIIFMLFLLLISHLIACLWYFIPKFFDEEFYWVVQTHRIDDSNFEKYLLSLYWTLATVFTVGFGDIHAYNEIENVFSIIWMVFGVVFVSIIIGTLSSIIANSESRETKLNKKLMILKDFSRKTKLNPLLAQKIEFLLIYNSKKERVTNDFNVLSGIPSDLKVEVAKSVQNGLLKEIHFFNQYVTPEFIAIIIQFLVPKNFIEKDIIYDEGDIPQSIYFMLKGRVFFTKENIAYCTYVKGSYFGEIDILENHRIHSVIAASNCEFVTLSKNVYVDIIEKDFQEIFRKIVKFSKIRKRRLKHLEERMLKSYYSKGDTSINISSRFGVTGINSTLNKVQGSNTSNTNTMGLGMIDMDNSGIFSEVSSSSSSSSSSSEQYDDSYDSNEEEDIKENNE